MTKVRSLGGRDKGGHESGPEADPGGVGVVFIFVGIAGVTVKGLGIELGPIRSPGRQFLIVIARVVLMSLGFALPASKGSAHPDPTTTSVSPISPEETIEAYLQALATRDFRTAKRLKPALDPEHEGWLEKPSPVAHISLLSAKPIQTGSSKTTVRAHIHYCREDGTGTNETKRYALALNATGAWEIRIEEHLPPTPTDIRC